MADEKKELAALNEARQALGLSGPDGPPPGVRPLQRQTDELATTGDWGPEAEALNRRLLELDPHRKVAMTRLARCFRERGDLEAAEALYGELIAIDPTNTIAFNFLRGLRIKREKAIAEEVAAAAAARKLAVKRRPKVAAAKVGQVANT
jgi:tetratricopeptide (TPR) repeat protein